MVTIRTRTGVHSGRTAETIVRRWYGRNAEISWNTDPAAEHLGLIVRPVDGRSHANSDRTTVLDTLLSVSST